MTQLRIINRLVLPGIALFAIIAGSLFCPSNGFTTGDIDAKTVYIAPDGDDNQTGESPSQALKSIQRLQVMLKEGKLIVNGKRLFVKFLPGTYYHMGVNWDYLAPDLMIFFEPHEFPQSSFPVTFDGTGDKLGQLFLLRITSIKPDPIKTGIVIRGLHVTNYCEGLSLGDWKSEARITDNVIEGNRFSRIGSKYESPTIQSGGRRLPEGRCVAAVRLNKASNNIIQNNIFSDIENLPVNQTGSRKYGPTLLHSIYINNGSSNNVIQKNIFRKFTGSPIRIRNNSNDNEVVNNFFETPVYSKNNRKSNRIKAVSQWYCNTAVEACREKSENVRTECPSKGILLKNNIVGKDIDLYGDESQSKIPTGSCGNSEEVFLPVLSN